MGSPSLLALILTHQSPFLPAVHLNWQLVATGHRLDSTIAISHLLSQTPLQLIDTGAEIRIFSLTDNVLLVLDSDELVA